jgi:putative ABC transport system permease protein
VGVAANVNNGGLSGEQLPELYRLRRNRAEDWNQSASVILETTLPTDAVEQWVRSEIADLDPTLPVQIDTLHHTVQRIADRPRFETMLVSSFAIVGLLLALVGLYGVIAFLVAQRRREIGLRIALGASRVDILRLVVARGMVLVAIGGVAGLVVASFLSRLLSSLLFSVGPHDPFSLAGVALVLIAVALLAMLVPAFSAMNVDPNVALRCE